MSGGRYRILPHTADLRLEVRESDLPRLFARCIEAMFSMLTDRRLVRARETRTFRVRGDDPGDLLYLVLREALLFHSVETFLVRNARATIESSGVSVEISGEPLDGARHPLYREIKAVTAHAIAVEKFPGGFLARCLLDV